MRRTLRTYYAVSEENLSGKKNLTGSSNPFLPPSRKGKTFLVSVAWIAAGFLFCSPAFSETVSWYGNESIVWKWGGYTRSGERFNENALTCAAPSKKLIGKFFKVTNPKNGKSVIVRVNDTGSFKKYGRSLDLSKSAFKKIAPLRMGVIKVVIEEVKRGS
jgi:rare lipoprotein A